MKQDESKRAVAQAAKATGAGIKATQTMKAVKAKAPEVHQLVTLALRCHEGTGRARRARGAPQEREYECVGGEGGFVGLPATFGGPREWV